LAAWHARSAYCPGCGGRTEIIEAGWARRCSDCATVHFPRTDPAVIMAVTDTSDRLLLVRGAAWAPRRYSVVAGFVEAGESVEAAVAREVWEEAGLRVADVEYVASQPWPFPRSLMLGCRARLAPGEDRPRPDGQEVVEARLVSRDELTAAADDGSILLPGPTSIARLLIEDWYGGPIVS
ncbi:NAD(+) diphosphatase, partial [Actinomyces oris]|uniref:NAD(+) diphosphatase n=3 Tax=Actinomycetaceae TaxID=2049 RepID=UPI00049404C3